MTRILITGGPRTGKTTLARQLFEEAAARYDRAGITAALLHTDDLIEQCRHLGKDAWSEASRIASTWLDEGGPWIIEGVAVSRALRKWHEVHPNERPPVDRVVYLGVPHVALTKGQESMAKGVFKVHFEDVEGWLNQHGITTEYVSQPSEAPQGPRSFMYET